MLALAGLTTCTVSCQGEVRPLETQGLAVLRQPLEGLVALLVLHRELDFWSKGVFRKHDRETGLQC